jgi:hypothetical protein
MNPTSQIKDTGHEHRRQAVLGVKEKVSEMFIFFSILKEREYFPTISFPKTYRSRASKLAAEFVNLTRDFARQRASAREAKSRLIWRHKARVPRFSDNHSELPFPCEILSVI